MVLRADPPQHLHPGEGVEAAVEPSSVGDRINVAADEQFLFAIAPQGGPKIPRRVFGNFHRKPVEALPQKFARLDPDRRKSHPLRAVLVAGQCAQCFEFFDCPPGIQGVGHDTIVHSRLGKKRTF